MSEWSDGYRTDIAYTYGYYAELNPLRVALPFLAAGLAVPKFETACELGFGQGLSVNMHAAASGIAWFGTDFNPAQAGFARELAGISGARVKLFDQAFAEFCSRPDLPDFDFIGLHGIWSWISDANRQLVVDFLRRKLKVGGVLYISYNSQPGWAAMTPVRELLCRHAEVMGDRGRSIVGRVDAALDFAEKLLALNPVYGLANPHITEKVGKLREQNRNYLAHEYFNAEWTPMSHALMAEWLAPAKLDYACSAHFPDHIDVLHLSPEQQSFLKEISDPGFREIVRDFMCNTQFRRDYWVKGLRRLGSVEQRERIGEQRVVLLVPREAVTLKVRGARGECALTESVYAPLLDLLADHKARSLEQLERAGRDKGINLPQLMQALLVLTGKGDVVPAQDEAVIAKARPVTEKLNRHLMRLSRGSGDVAWLAGPVTGGALSVGRFAQLFLLARKQGLQQPGEWAAFAWRFLEAANQRLIKDGRPVDSAEDNLAELDRQAAEFADKQLAALTALQIA